MTVLGSPISSSRDLPGGENDGMFRVMTMESVSI